MAEIGASSYRRFLLGEEDAIGDLVREYSDGLVRFAFGYVHSAAISEDIVSDAMAAFLLKRKHFPDENRMRAYLFKMVHSRSMDYLRRDGREIPLEDVETVLGDGDPLDEILRRERDAILYRGLLLLPLQYRQVLELTYLEDFAPKAVAGIISCSAKQVYNLLARAKSSLRMILEKEGITYEDLR